MRKHQATFGGRKRPHTQMELSQESEPDLTPSDVKEDKHLFSQESQESQPNKTESQSQPLTLGVHAAAPPLDLVVEYEEGLPELLYQDLQSDEADRVAQAGEEIYKRLEGNSNKSLAEFIGMGGHTVVLMVMKRWPLHAKIQGKGCSCIASLVHHWQYDATLIKMNIVEYLNKMGTMEQVVSALTQFPKEMGVQSSGISAMTNLCYNYQNPKQAKMVARRLCLELNGARIVANAMREFPIHCRLQQLGCWFFRRMCTLGLGKETVLKKEALVAIATAVQTFPNQSEIHADAYNAMTAIMKPTSKPSAG